MKSSLIFFMLIVMIAVTFDKTFVAEASFATPALNQDLNLDWVSENNNGFTITANDGLTFNGDPVSIWLSGSDGAAGPFSFTISADEQFAGGAFDLTEIVFDLYEPGSTFTIAVIGHKAGGGTVMASVSGGGTAEFNAINLGGMTELTAFDVQIQRVSGFNGVDYVGLDSFTIANPHEYVGNHAPEDIAGLGEKIIFQENTVNAAPRQIDPDVAVTDSDSDDFNSGQVTVSYTATGLAEDQLVVDNIGNISVSGSAVSYSGTQIGTVSGGNNGAALIIDLSANATPAQVTELLRALAYQNTSNEPASYRTISITVNDGDGGTSAPATARIAVSGQAESGVESPVDLTQNLSYPDWVDHLNNYFAITANGSVTLSGDLSTVWIEGGGTGPASLTVSAAEQFAGGMFDLAGMTFDFVGSGNYTVTVKGYRAGGDTVTANVTGSSEGEFNAVDLAGMTQLNSFEVQIQSSGGGDVYNLGLASFTIANPHAVNLPPAFTSAVGFSIAETALANDTVLHDVQAHDGDGGATDAGLTYRITGGTGRSYFSIDSSTGEIKLTAAGEASLDYESAASYTLIVRADDGRVVNSTADQTIAVSVADAAPAITGGQSFTVSETAPDGTVVGVVANTGDNDSVTFSITGGNSGGAFAIDAAGAEITVNNAGAIDYEADPSFTLTVQATDETNSSDQGVTVNVSDVAPVITAGQSFTVSEGAADGTAVGTVAVTGDISSIVFSIQSGNDDGVFAINSSTGEISVADSANLDAAITAVHTLAIRASDANHSDEMVTVLVRAADGSGTMTVTPDAVAAGQTGITLTFTYTAAAGGLENGAVSIDVPDGWSPPGTISTGAGYTTASAGTVGVSGRSITVTGLTLAGSDSIAITYGDKSGGGPGITAATTAGVSTWPTRSGATSAGSLAGLSISPQVTIEPGGADPDQSSVTVDETARPADNTTIATITVTLRDAHGNPVIGHTAALDQGAGSSTIEPAGAVTDAAGQAVFTVKSGRAESVTYQAKDTTPEPDVTVIQTVQVTFEPGVTVDPADDSAVEGGTAQYAVALLSRPTADVAISVTPDTQLSADKDSLIFNSANYNTPQTVTVTAIDNHILDGNRTGAITHAAVSADPAYGGITVPGFLMDITDNDSPDIIVSKSGPLQITEGGPSDSYTLTLATQPADSVTVYVYGGGQVAVDPQVLEFTTGNWNVPLGIDITAVDDDVAEGPHAATVTHSVYSADPDYGGFNIPDLDVDITDNDSPGISINQSGAAVVTEGGGDYIYTMVLTTRPCADVEISISGGSQLGVDPGEHTFTPGNWDSPKTVRVWALDDDVSEGDHSGSVSHSVYSADPGYDNYDISAITVSIIDNDASANACLSGLVLSGGTLVPAFDPATTNYSLSVAHSVGSVSVTPTPADSNATVTVNGTPVAGGHVSPSISLNVGANPIIAVVTAQDGITTKTYTITVNRAAASGGGGSSDKNKPLRNDGTSKNIKADAGGKVSLGNVSVEIPAGALPDDATVSIRKLSRSEANKVVPGGLRVKMAGDVYEITTTGERWFGDNYITIKLAYDPDRVAEGEFPAVHYYDQILERWVKLETQLMQENGQWFAVAGVNHLTRFAVFSTAKEPPAEQEVITLTIGQVRAGVNGSPFTLDAPPYVDHQSRRVLVPIRFVSEALGAGVKWDSTLRQVTIEDGGRVIVLTMGSPEVLVDGAARAMDCVPGTQPPGRIFVPLRFVSETLGAQVDYDDAAKQITLLR